MQLRNKKQLPKMTRPPPNSNTASSNVASGFGTATNPPGQSGTTQSTQSSTVETVVEPVGTTRVAQTSQAMPTMVMATSTSQAIPTASMAAQTTQAIPTSGVLNLGSGRRMPYGIPTSMMQGLHTNPSASSETLNVSMPQLFNPGVSVPFGSPQQSFIPFCSPQQSLTNASLSAPRQQMEETNHEMVNMVTQQIGVVINPLIQDSNRSYQALFVQMEQMADFFGAPAARNVPTPRNLSAGVTESLTVGQTNQAPEIQEQAQRVPTPAPEEPATVPILVNRHQDADCNTPKSQHKNFCILSELNP